MRVVEDEQAQNQTQIANIVKVSNIVVIGMLQNMEVSSPVVKGKGVGVNMVVEE